MIQASRVAILSLTCAGGLLAQAPNVTWTTKPMFGTAILVAKPHVRMDALVDVNHDGKMDAIGFWTSPGKPTIGELKAMINDGSARLSEHIVQTGISIGRDAPTPDVFLGDWNGDGKPDFGLDQRTATFSFFVTSTAGPTIATHVNLPIAGALTGIVGADFNGDKLDDVAILTTTHLYVYLNAQGYPRTLGFTRPGGGTELRLVDVDHDGEQDLVYLVNRSDVQMLKVHRKSGWTGLRTDTVTNHAAFSTGSTATLHPTCGDIDGDTDQDVVLFGNPGFYQVLRQGAGGRFRQENWVRGGPATALADVDGDGDLDGICCGGGGSSGRGNYTRSRFEVAINDNGQFRPALAYENIGARHIAGAADMDGDGKVDLVAGRGILFHRGQFEAAVSRWIVGPNRSKVGVRGITDYDGDGDLDIDNDWGLRDHYRNPGDGNMQMIAAETPTLPQGKQFLGNLHFRGDFDGDGDQDLLVAVGYPMTLHLLRNEDGVRYSDAGPITPSGDSLHPSFRTSALQAGYFACDLNRDGRSDLITYHQNQLNRIFLSDGAGNFTETNQRLGIDVRGVRDLNGDSYPDVFGRLSNGEVRVLFGSKTGTFSGSTVLLNLPAPTSFDVVDYDGDGDADVVVTEREGISGTTLRIYANTPSGFQPHVLMTNMSSYAALQVRDLDGDGRKDIFVSPASRNDSKTVITLRQTATGGFEWSEQMMFDENFALGDIDGDGDQDVVGDVVLLRNVTYHTPTSGSMQQFGDATKGRQGVRPQLGATGPFREGHDSSLILRHPIPKGFAVIVVGVQEANLIDFPWVGANTYVASPPVSALAQADDSGVWAIRAKIPSGLGGSTILFQAYVVDPSSASGFVTTNGVRIAYGK